MLRVSRLWPLLCFICGVGTFALPATAFGQIKFVIRPIAVSATTDARGPQLGPGTSFTGFNGFPSVGITGEVAYPGNVTPGIGGASEGFWLHRAGQNVAIAVRNDDGVLGPGLGNGVVLDNMFQDSLNGAPGEVLIGGFLSGAGVSTTNHLVYMRHRNGLNMPLARTGVSNSLGPGLGDNIVFRSFVGAQINADSNVLLRASLTGSGVTPATSEGLWNNITTGNTALARSGVGGSLGPGLGGGVTFYNNDGSTNAFEQHQLLENGDAAFVGKTFNSATSATGIGLWKNSDAGNVPLAITGATDNLGPGMGPGETFGNLQQIPFGHLEFDANALGSVAFTSTLNDGRRGVWRNLGQQNEPIMLVGDSGALGPGVGFNDTFGHFTPTILLPEIAINNDHEVLFPGRLTGSGTQGLWLHTESGNEAIALTGDDGDFGPGLGAGITFTGFNRAYFGSDDTVFFTADLSFNVPSNRLLGLWAYRDGKIQPIAVYNEWIDVDPTDGVDERQVRWVQIPSDYTYHNDFGANEFDQLVFRVGFQDGTQGIFMAAPIPEPQLESLLAAFALIVPWISRYRYRMHRSSSC